jgi:hypothetical protein
MSAEELTVASPKNSQVPLPVAETPLSGVQVNVEEPIFK